MTILGKRIIEYLKSDSTLVGILSDNKSIFAFDGEVEKEKYIVVEINAGKDEVSIPVVSDTISILVIVKHSVLNAIPICLDIADRVDTLLDKHPENLSDSDYNIISFSRVSGTSPAYDEKTKSFWIELQYKYMLTE